MFVDYIQPADNGNRGNGIHSNGAAEAAEPVSFPFISPLEFTLFNWLLKTNTTVYMPIMRDVFISGLAWG